MNAADHSNHVRDGGCGKKNANDTMSSTRRCRRTERAQAHRIGLPKASTDVGGTWKGAIELAALRELQVGTTFV